MRPRPGEGLGIGDAPSLLMPGKWMPGNLDITVGGRGGGADGVVLGEMAEVWLYSSTRAGEYLNLGPKTGCN